MTAELLSTIAIILSGISLLISIIHLAQDQSNLHADSTYYTEWEGNPPYIQISLRNSGRRPIILRCWGGSNSTGDWLSQRLGDNKKGLRLGESEWHEFSIYYDDIFNMTPDNDEIIFKELWVEDSLNHRYIIEKSKENISKLTGSS